MLSSSCTCSFGTLHSQTEHFLLWRLFLKWAKHRASQVSPWGWIRNHRDCKGNCPRNSSPSPRSLCALSPVATEPVLPPRGACQAGPRAATWELRGSQACGSARELGRRAHSRNSAAGSCAHAGRPCAPGVGCRGPPAGLLGSGGKGIEALELPAAEAVYAARRGGSSQQGASVAE